MQQHDTIKVAGCARQHHLGLIHSDSNHTQTDVQLSRTRAPPDGDVPS